jgi:hypothetical protein
VPFEDVLLQDERLDISAGRWRATVFDGEDKWPAVHPHHERRKYLETGRRLRKFVGLAFYGRNRYRLAKELEEPGYIPNVFELDNGFMVSEFIEGTPLTGGNLSGDLLAQMGAYLRFRSQLPATDATSFDEICELLTVNTEELLGRRVRELEDWRSVIEDAQPCKVDGRMLPHEWIAVSTGYLKTDALDHHDDHFFPGCTDIAWDVAATCIEWELDDSGRAFLLRELGGTEVSRRLPFYEAAYLAFRAAYASMAVRTLKDGADAERFRLLERAYVNRLAQSLHELETVRV